MSCTQLIQLPLNFAEFSILKRTHHTKHIHRLLGVAPQSGAKSIGDHLAGRTNTVFNNWGA